MGRPDPLAAALCVSLAYGAADYAAARAIRRIAPARLVLIGQTVSALVTGLWLAGARAAPPTDAATIALGLGAGACNGLALAFYLRALGLGPAGVVSSALAAGVALPVGLGLARAEAVSPWLLLGLGLALAGVLLSVADGRGDPATGRKRVRLAEWAAPTLAASLFSGGATILLEAAAKAGAAAEVHTLWPALGLQVGGAGAMALALALGLARGADGASGWRGVVEPRLAAIVGLAIALGLLGDAALTFAFADGPLASVAVLSTLDPLVIGLLAWALAGERLSRRQILGATVALTGVVLTAAAG